MINAAIESKLESLAAICRRYDVRVLSLFGSAGRSDFRPDSDVDLLVEFEAVKMPGLLRMAELRDELERLFGRNVDLSTSEILRNPYRRPRSSEIWNDSMPPEDSDQAYHWDTRGELGLAAAACWYTSCPDDLIQAFDHLRDLLRCRPTETLPHAFHCQRSNLADLHP